MDVLFRKMGGFHRYHDVYEWSVNGQRWYGIHGENIVVDGAAAVHREIMNRVLRGATIRLRACYVKSLRVLCLSPGRGIKND